MANKEVTQVMTSREYYIHKGYFKPYEGLNFYPTPEHVEEYAEYYHSAKSQPAQDVMDEIPEWVKGLSEAESKAMQEKECVDEAHKLAWEKYPYQPFAMRGKNYSPIDLNLKNRQVFVEGYQLNRQEIDWDGLEKKYKEWCRTNGGSNVHYLIFQWFRTRIQSLVVGDGWVSVADRLPDDEEHVNIVNDGIVSTATYKRGQSGIGKFGRYKNYSENDRCATYYYTNVTHWQPLPLPPSPTK